MKKSFRDNFRVVVDPDSIWLTSGQTQEETERRYERRCEDIASSIKRHVDDVSRVVVDWDTHYYCGHCLEEWDADKTTGEPFCCDKAIEEWEKQNAT